MNRDNFVLDISNMKCAGCIAAIETALNNLGDVDILSINIEDHKAVVNSPHSVKDIVKTITEAGFPASQIK